MNEIPFSSFNNSLRDEILNNHLINGIKWLLGSNIEAKRVPKKYIIAQFGNSSWETSLSLISFLKYRKIILNKPDIDDQHLKVVSKIEEVTPFLVEYLLSCNCNENDGLTSWESVTWDTAVVIRAINMASIEMTNEIASSLIERINNTTKKSIIWLCDQFLSWEVQVKYPFGYADVSQILMTMIYLYQNNRNVLFKEYHNRKPQQYIQEICTFLLHAQKEEKSHDSTSEAFVEIQKGWWDDPFTTAEVLESLAHCCDLYSNNILLSKQYSNTQDNIKKAIVNACTYLEKSQIDGMWGSHIDTIRIISTYVKIGNLLNVDTETEIFLQPEVHTTFKALRWILDEKQNFKDGSFLHTLFLTVFFVQSLLEVYENWEPAKKEIGVLYDDVVWSSPVRSTPERNKRLNLELILEKRERDFIEMSERNLKLDIYRKTLLLTILTILVAAPIAYLLEIIDVSFTTSEKTNEILSFVFGVVGFYITITIYIWRSEWKKTT